MTFEKEYRLDGKAAIVTGASQGKYDVTDILQRTPTRRLVEVDDVANAVIFLASDAASSITGVNLPVDGGWQAYGYI